MRGLGVYAVFVDANVLYSKTLRDWLCLLSEEQETDVFRVFWSEDVVVEAVYHLRKDHPTWNGRQIAAVRDNLVAALGDGRVADFDVDSSFTGTDPDDAHVHSAAIACAGDILLTEDSVDDFAVDPDALPYEIWTPDDFFVLVDEIAPQVVRAVIRRQIDYWFPKRGEVDLPSDLRNANAPLFAEVVRKRQLAL